MIIYDQAIREKAIDPRHSFIVEAPAGAGKTEILVQRILSLLALSVRFPEEILAITFTRKAAYEMRSRIISALEKAQANETNALQQTTLELAKKVLVRSDKENWQLLANPHRLNIQTIDALCMRLTTQMPILSGMGGDAALSNQPQVLYQQSVQAILATLDEATPWQKDLITVFNHFDNQYAVIEDVFVDMLKRRDQWLPYIVGVADPVLLKTQFEAHLNNIMVDILMRVVPHFPQALQAQLLPLLRYAADNSTTDSPLKVWQDITVWPTINVATLDQWLGLVELLLTKEGEYRKQIDKRIGFPANAKNDHKKNIQELLAALAGNEELRLALVLLREAPPLQYSQSSWDFLRCLLTILPLMAAQLLVTFRQKGQVDFIEVSRRALQALGENEAPTDLALVLDYQLQHILVDEFQDTSITQFNLLEKMTCTWQHNDGHTLFLVGDPQQSIYRFRQANVGLFLKAKYHGIGEIKLTPLQLCMNFRSQSSLVNWVNQVMPSIMPKQAHIGLGAISFTPATAANASMASSAVHFVRATDTAEEAQLLALQIKQLKQQQPNVRVAILVRASSHLSEILPQLKAHHIAYQAIDIEPLTSCNVVNDLLALTRALLHFYDRVAWLALLRSPLCGLTLAEIELLTVDDTISVWDTLQDPMRLTELSSESSRRVMRLVNALMPTLQTRGRLSLAQWVHSAWLALGGMHYSSAAMAADINAFYQLLTTLEQDYGFVEAELLTEQVAQLYIPQIIVDEYAVQVMTIHKAKGLEFDVVFLPGLSRKIATSTPPLLRYVEQTLENSHYWLLAPIHAKAAQPDPIYQYLGQIEKRQEAYETQRLLYVALTRAKQELYLFAVSEENINPPAGSLLALLEKSRYPQDTCHSQDILRHPRFRGDDGGRHRDAGMRRGDDGQILNRLPVTWQLPEPWHHWLYHTPSVEITENNVDTSLYEPDTLMRKQTGTLLHRIFNYMATHHILTWTQAEIKQHAQRWRLQLLELGISTEQLAAAQTLLIQAVNNILQDPHGQWILQPHLEEACEYALHTIYKNKHTKIIIDRTFVFNNERWIIDYKTGNEQEEINTYIMQLQQYAQIIQQIDSRPIRLGLYFPMTMTWKEITCDNLIKL